MGFKIDSQKCTFLHDLKKDGDIQALGYNLSYEGITASPKYINSLKKIKAPADLKQLMSLLGSLNYIRIMLPLKMHESINMLYTLLREKTFKWTEIAESHYRKIMKGLEENVFKLYVPSRNSIYMLYTDASSYGLGATLLALDLQEYLPKLLRNEVSNYPQKDKTINKFLNTQAKQDPETQEILINPETNAPMLKTPPNHSRINQHSNSTFKYSEKYKLLSKRNIRKKLPRPTNLRLTDECRIWIQSYQSLKTTPTSTNTNRT